MTHSLNDVRVERDSRRISAFCLSNHNRPSRQTRIHEMECRIETYSKDRTMAISLKTGPGRETVLIGSQQITFVDLCRAGSLLCGLGVKLAQLSQLSLPPLPPSHNARFTGKIYTLPCHRIRKSSLCLLPVIEVESRGK